MRSIRTFLLVALLSVVLTPAPGGAHDETEFQTLYAPFECGSEWDAPFGAHHSHAWNLDFNRTSLNYGEDRQHDLGQPLFAQGDGTIVRIAAHSRAGTYVEIDYGDYTVVYVHLVHDSVAEGLEVGSQVTTGQFFAELGDTGNAHHAHLHIEYFDSRGLDDYPSWQIKRDAQPGQEVQTEVTFNGNPVDYDEVIVSQNCVGDAAGAVDLDGDALELLSSTDTRLPALIHRLQQSTEATDGSTEHDSYLHETDNGTNVFARIPGTDLAAETILISTSYTSAFDCAPDEAAEPVECPGTTEHAASTSLVLDLADALAAAETPPRRTILFAFWDEHDAVGGAAEAWYSDDATTLDDDVVAIVDYGIQGANATLPLRRTTTASTFDDDWHALAERFVGYGTPDLTEFPTGRFHSAAAGQLADMALPLVAFADIAGPCVGTTDDDSSAVDTHKLHMQTGEAIEFVSTIASADAIATDAPGDHRADAAALLAIVELAGYAGDAYDALQAILDIPDEPVGATLAAAEAQLLADLAAEPCAGHGATAPFTDLRADSYARLDVTLLYDLAITTGTSPTTYSPTDAVTREQMGAFLGRLWRLFNPDAAPTVDMPFGDVADTSYAYDDIRLLFELGITTGTSPTTYSPADPVTREQMAAFLARVWRELHPDHDPGAVPEHPFGDVESDSFAYDDISLIAWLGITTGTSPTTYSPDDDVTREQMAAFLARLIRTAGSEPEPEPDPDAEPDPKPDVPPVEPADG